MSASASCPSERSRAASVSSSATTSASPRSTRAHLVGRRPPVRDRRRRRGSRRARSRRPAQPGGREERLRSWRFVDRALEGGDDDCDRRRARDPGARPSARRGRRRGPCARPSERSRACPPRLPRVRPRGRPRACSRSPATSAGLQRLEQERRPSSCRRARPRRARRSRASAASRASTRASGSICSASPRLPARPCEGRSPRAGPLAPPTVETSVEPAAIEELAGRRAAVEVVELVLDGGEPTRHVRAVVGVADRRVELGEVVTLLGDRRRAVRSQRSVTSRSSPRSRASSLRRPTAARRS